jgi:rhomboid protease GluP
MFIHIGVIHVFFNMMVLWTLGDFVEKLFGHVNFLLLYIFSGLIGSLCSIVWNPNVVSAGASGAVFGVFGGLCGYLVACKKDIPLVIFAQMKKNVLVFLGLNLAFGLSVPNIDMAAHMGGLAGGFIAALFLSHSFNEKGLKSISKRGIVFAVFALVSLFSLFSFISSEFKVPFETTFKKFSTLDVKFAKILEEGQSDMATNTLSVEEFIEALEGEVIPEWKRIRLEFIDNRPFGRSNKTYERVDTYMDLKGQLWMNLLKGYRENDASYFEKVEELGKKIEEMNP